jgi:hypothetical protein
MGTRSRSFNFSPSQKDRSGAPSVHLGSEGALRWPRSGMKPSSIGRSQVGQFGVGIGGEDVGVYLTRGVQLRRAEDSARAAALHDNSGQRAQRAGGVRSESAVSYNSALGRRATTALPPLLCAASGREPLNLARAALEGSAPPPSRPRPPAGLGCPPAWDDKSPPSA